MMGNAKEEGSDAHNNNNNTYENRNNLTIMTENDNIPTNERGESSTNSAESIKMNNTMTSSVGSLPNLNMNSKYDDYDEAQLEEFAQIASPKVSELLKEQALALDDLLGSAWMNNSSGSSSSDDSDAQLRRAKRKERRRRGHGNEHKNKQPHNKRHNDGEEEEDEDGMNEECKRLTAAEMELRNELELATNGFASLMNFDNNFYAEDDFDGDGNVDDDEDYYDGTIDFDKDGGINKDGGEVKQSATTGQHNMISQTVQPPLSKNTAMAKVDGGDSDIGPSDPQVRQQHHQTRKSNDTNSYAQGSPSNAKMSYSLADHALTLDVSRSAAGMYTRPLLSRHDLETLGIVTLPSWIVRPGGEGDSNDASSPINSPSNSRGYIENTSRGREDYMKRVLSCTAEYVEPPKSKTLRKLFSGWNPGPGERRTEDISTGGDRGRGGEGGGVGGSGDDPQRVMAYSPSPQHVDGDSSVEENDGNDSENFVDVEGVSYPTSPPVHRIREPRPVRVVTIRIRPDVLCGATMDALTMTVERLGGEITKRQGGHMRAILPGVRKRIWMPGEWEREREYKSPSTSNDACLNGNGTNYLDSGESQSGNNEYVMVNDDNEDASSVASGLSSFLSLASPIKIRSNRSKQPKGPRYVTLPPYLVDAQLVTKKLGKECQRVLLLRIYRIQDIACMGSVGGEEEEVLDVPAPLNKEDFGGGSTANGTSLNNDNNGNNSIGGDQGKRIDSELESECSLKALREAAALVQRIKVVGADGFAVDLPSPMIDTLENTRESMSTISQSNQSTETKSYFKSFSDALVSPVKYFSGNESTSQMDEAMQSPGVPQRHIHTPNTSKRRPPTAMELMSDELMQKYYPSPSVGTRPSSKLAVAKKKSHGIFPSLSKEDSPYVKSSWLFLRECIDEMDRRNLAYSTLGTSSLFQFPALPTLDAHFISQIKGFCRESMIISLVKTASELEIYAREFEASCNNLDQLLKSTFHMYRLDPPALPTPVPLTAYPLDFQSPEDVSPPWGPEVMKVLDSISNFNDRLDENNITDCQTSDSVQSLQQLPRQRQLSSFERAEEAISLIVMAFQRQNDVEQGARLGRKNMQVMDRLAKMQAHKRNSIAKISASYGSNLLATNAADEYHSNLRKCPNVGSLSGTFHSLSNQVPLIICNVMVGNATGTCYVTDSHILFVTQLVPILGGNRVHLFSIADVELTIHPPSKSMLSPLPASISLTITSSGNKSTREEVYRFIPSIGARRFAKFVEVVKDVAVEDPNALKFSDRGGLIYMYDESN